MVLVYLVRSVIRVSTNSACTCSARNLGARGTERSTTGREVFSVLPRSRGRRLVSLFSRFRTFRATRSGFTRTVSGLRPLVLGGDGNKGS